MENMIESTLDLEELQKLRPTDSKTQGTQENGDVERKWGIILEPVLIGAMIAINLGQTSLQNFYLRTACTVDLGLPLDVCDRGVGEEFRTAEAASQVVVSNVNVSRSFVGSLLATFVMLFVGPWSDYSGRRKPLLIMPLLGMCIMTTGVILMLIFPGASTVQVLYAVQIPISICGNFGLLLAASFSHIGDHCHRSGRDVSRTIGTHRAAMQVAHVVGALGGPLLYKQLGFFGVFPIVLLLQASSLIYVVIMVKDVNVNAENKVSVFNWRLPVRAFQCAVRPREGHKRLVIFLVMIVGLVDRTLLAAEVLLSYMYFRFKFRWDDLLFGSYLAYRNSLSFFGTIFILTILKRRFNLADEVVGALSCFSCVVTSSSLMAATSTLVVFILPLVGLISQGSQVVQRALLTKQIFPTEQGKIFSVMCALESATQTLSSPLYSLLYKHTVSSLPDAWLLPGIALATIQILSYLFIRKLNKDKPNGGTPPTINKNANIIEFNTKSNNMVPIIKDYSRT